MKRKLGRQAATEWRSNLWLVIELLIVSVIVWYITDYMWVRIMIQNEPTGFDTTDVFMVEYATVSPDSPRYIPLPGATGDAETDQAADTERRASELRNLVQALRSRPDVVAVSVSNNAQPYINSWYGSPFQRHSDSLEVHINRRRISPDHIKVMGYQGTEFTTAEQAMDELRKGHYLISEFVADKSQDGNVRYVKVNSEDLIGTEVFWWNDSTATFTIGGVIKPVKRNDTENAFGISLFEPIDEATDGILEAQVINVRVRPEAAAEFAATITRESERTLRFGNTYIQNVKPYSKVRETNTRKLRIEIRKYMACMVFMLVSVFLGLLGTFWFRTQQRVGEIAIRKVNGATSGSVFLRLVSEGLLLLVIATVPAVIIDWVISHYELNASYGWYYYSAHISYLSPGRFLTTTGITFLLMAAMIVGGIWFPARRAMRVDPARSLADE